MKIEIEFDNSYEAKLVIDGREMRVVSNIAVTSLEGVKSPEIGNTMGGMVADELFSKIHDIQRAWASIEGSKTATWETLNEKDADQFYDEVT